MRSYEFIEATDSQLTFIIGDSHAKALGGANNLAQNGARMSSIFQQARYVPTGSKVIVSGGGIKNRYIFNILKKKLKSKLCIIDHFKLDKDFIESQAFAYLAIRRLKRLPISFPKTTGVSFPVSGGKITSYR